LKSSWWSRGRRAGFGGLIATILVTLSADADPIEPPRDSGRPTEVKEAPSGALPGPEFKAIEVPTTRVGIQSEIRNMDPSEWLRGYGDVRRRPLAED
jgi:hypothetical protein